MPNSADKVFDIYGDESCRGRWVGYGGLVVQSSQVSVFEAAVSQLKTKFNGTDICELHCSKMFNGSQRKKTPWQHLNIDQVFELYGELASISQKISYKRIISYADRSDIPKFIPAKGGFPEIRFDEKEVAAFCGNALMIPFQKEPGLSHIRFWADPDFSKISWNGISAQAKNALNAFIDSGGSSPDRVIPEEITGNKPPLLEIADAIAYISTRVLSGIKTDHERFQELYDSFEIEKIRVGRAPNGGLGVNIPNELLKRPEAL